MGQVATSPNARQRTRLAIVDGGGVPPPSAIVLDNFNRGDDAGNLGNASGTGQTWVQNNGTWGIISNTAYQSANGSNVVLDKSATIDSGVVACTIELDVPTVQAGQEIGGGIIFRYSDTTHYFAFMFYRSSVGQAFYFLFKQVGATNTVLYNSSAGVPLGGLLKIVDTSTNIKPYVARVQVGAGVEYTDSALNTNTKQGMFVEYGPTGSGTGTGWRFDSYSVT